MRTVEFVLHPLRCSCTTQPDLLTASIDRKNNYSGQKTLSCTYIGEYHINILKKYRLKVRVTFAYWQKDNVLNSRLSALIQ